MRQLATVRVVSQLIPIEGADLIELAKLDGWQCVVKKGDFVVGDPGLYFEIDSILPADDPRFAFLEPRKYRIKSMKLRGALSQGLLMPLGIMTDDEVSRWKAGEELLTDIMRVQKYEVPLPMGGKQKGTFPTHLVPKTDQERIQNIPEALEGREAGEFEITEKLDGTSCTIFAYNDIGPDVHGDTPSELRIRVGVCSRNWEMEPEDGNVYARILAENDLVAKLRKLDRNLAIQGEIIGPGLQGNKYKRGAQELYVFDIYDIDKRCYLKPDERLRLTRALGLMHVPLVLTKFSFPLTLDVVLDFAQGKSELFDTQREGLVFKGNDGNLNFKAISNKFLLKHE